MLRGLVTIAAAVVTVAYPFLVYLGLTRWSARYVGLLVALVALVSLPLRLRDEARREHAAKVLLVPAVVVVLGMLSVLLDSASFVLFMPVLISAALLVTFAVTLRAGTVPMIESFARLQEPDLTSEEIGWCRTVTKIWCCFFVFNGAVSLWLALFAPLVLWAIYCGAVAYGLMGLLLAGEFLARKWRFQKFGSGALDRLLERLLARGETP